MSLAHAPARRSTRQISLVFAAVLTVAPAVSAQKNAPPPQAPAPVPAAPAGPTPAQIAAQMDSIRTAEASQVITRCQVRDGVDPPNIRVRCWEAARMGAPTDPRVVEGMLNAQSALDAAEKTAATEGQAKSTRDSVKTFIARARADIASGSPDGADTWVTYALEKDPANPEALALRSQVGTMRVLQSRKQLLMVVAGVITALCVGFGALAKKLFANRKKPAEREGSAPVASGRRVALKIVDGIGRGRMYTVESDVFRIGAAESERKEEKNDLVINDSAGLISRFHCAILKREKKWIVVDSSLNGTLLNDKPLERGEPHNLRDGDELTVAGVSRLTFLTL